MKLLFIVLNKVDKLDELLEEFGKNNITEATIINSTGMMHELLSHDDLGFIGAFRQLLDPQRKENRTIYMVVSDEKVDKVIEIVDKVVEGIDNPDTGIIFTVPVDLIRGVKISWYFLT